MHSEHRKWNAASGWSDEKRSATPAALVLVFGGKAALRDPKILGSIREFYPGAYLAGCSTAGEICGTEVSDDAVVATAIHFESAQIRSANVSLAQFPDCLQAGKQLAQALPRTVRGAASEAETLRHVFVLSDGLQVNGSELVRGILSELPADVTVTGGLAGDGARFAETVVIADGQLMSRTVVAIGFYGRRLRIGFGSKGGWEAFGPERLITEAKGNVLFKLDGHSALQLYRQYLGSHAAGLPGTALLFPLSIRHNTTGAPVVRTVLAVDPAQETMTFAGDLPVGSFARLMKANSDHLIEGAKGAAQACASAERKDLAELAILISCVGRKLVLKQRTEEEVEAVQEVLGPRACLTGFYSYGEIAPFGRGSNCELHNQTMTVTTFSEAGS